MRGRRVRRIALGIAVWLASSGAASEPVINTIAGGGPNDVPAVAANLAAPSGIAIDAGGNLFVAAVVQNRVFKIDGSGQLTVVAGDGTTGFSGDGGLATSGSLAYPEGVALDAAGNLFIADFYNHRIRRVDAVTQIITTAVGNGTCCSSVDGGLATNAGLPYPVGIVLDAAGNLFIASYGRIRRVDAITQIITTVAGNGTPGFSGDGGPATNASLAGPSGVALDAAGNLFIADEYNNRIRRVDAITGIITTIAGIGCPSSRCFSGDGGLATSAGLRRPTGVALDVAGNLFIADRGNRRIRRVDAISQIITTVAGSGALFSGDGGLATNAGFAGPFAVALDLAGNLFIADRYDQRVRRVDAVTQIIRTVAGNGTVGFGGDGDLATKASLRSPRGVARDAVGNLFIADTANSRIRRVDGATQIITTVAGNGTADVSGDGDLATSASLGYPSSVALDAADNLFIADEYNNRIRRVDAVTQIITTIAGNGYRYFSGDGGLATSADLNPVGVALDAAGNLFIADSWNHRIRRVDATTQIITTFAGDGCVEYPGPDGRPRLGCFGGDGGLATSGSLAYPEGVALDAAGNLFIADSGNHRIRRVDAITQIITTVAGNGTSGFGGDGGLATSAGLRRPTGVALDVAGNLFIADRGNRRIRRVDAVTQMITTVAGNETPGFSGDGGPATSASLAAPSGVALDSADNLFIADSGNNRIRLAGDEIIAIDIDIKPGSIPNSINPTDRGVIPVAILGSDSFDVSAVDGASLTFAAGEATPAHDLADQSVFANHLEDVNGDGIADLVSHYRTEETGIAYGDMSACLSGSTLDGVRFSGCDAVRTVPDMDGDRLLDPDEERAGTNAFYRDSDNDGYDDGTEVLALGTDPLDALDPAPTPVEQKKPSRLRNRRH